MMIKPGVGVCTFGTLGTLIVYVWYVQYVRYVNSKKVYVWYVYVRLRCTFDGLKCTFDVRLFPTLMRFDHSEQENKDENRTFSNQIYINI